MKHFISLVLAGVMTAVSVTFSSPTVTAETEHHDNVLITYFSRTVSRSTDKKPCRGDRCRERLHQCLTFKDVLDLTVKSHLEFKHTVGSEQLVLCRCVLYISKI